MQSPSEIDTDCTVTAVPAFFTVIKAGPRYLARFSRSNGFPFKKKWLIKHFIKIFSGTATIKANLTENYRSEKLFIVRRNAELWKIVWATFGDVESERRWNLKIQHKLYIWRECLVNMSKGGGFMGCIEWMTRFSLFCTSVVANGGAFYVFAKRVDVREV